MKFGVLREVVYLNQIKRMEYVTPSDCKEQTTLHSQLNGGCCAQACIAVVQRITIKEVFKRWEKHGLEWKGHTPVSQLRKYMDKEGYYTKLITTKNKTDFLSPYYLIRIQWIGNGEKKEKPFFGYSHWTIASSNTHYVLRQGDRFFCNETGWFEDIDQYLSNNQPIGQVTSIIEITPR